MPIEVIPGKNPSNQSGGSIEPTPEETPKTPIFSLKAKRQEIEKTLYLDLKVPRWEGDFEVWVRYGPVSVGSLEQATDKRSASRKTTPDWQVLANADVLVASCQAVFAVHPDYPGERFSLKEGEETGPLTKFDINLAKNLGITDETAVATCRALYKTDGDLISAANALLDWSSQASEKASADFS